MERNELKKLLPNGTRKEIATLAGVSTQSVTNFLAGKNNNYKIEIAAIEVAARIQSERKKALQKLQMSV